MNYWKTSIFKEDAMFGSYNRFYIAVEGGSSIDHFNRYPRGYFTLNLVEYVFESHSQPNSL